jgi:hypothetical protein
VFSFSGSWLVELTIENSKLMNWCAEELDSDPLTCFGSFARIAGVHHLCLQVQHSLEGIDPESDDWAHAVKHNKAIAGVGWRGRNLLVDIDKVMMTLRQIKDFVK